MTMSKVNLIDSLIISTGITIILKPLIKTLLRRTSSSSSKFEYVPKLKAKSKMVDLPDDVITIILSKLDIVTLSSCTTALSLEAFLPNIVSLSTPLPKWLFVSDRSAYWHGRVVNKILSKSWARLRHALNFMYQPLYNVLRTVNSWANTPCLSAELWWFIRELSGLKLLEVELPAFPCVVLKDRPKLWHKWEGKIGVHGVVDHFVHVFVDSIDDEIEEIDEHVRVSEGYLIAERIWDLNSSVWGLGYEGDNSWKTGLTIRTKDFGGNGALEIGPHPCFTDDRDRIAVYHLPSTSIFSKDSEQVQDVILMINLICPKPDDDFDVVQAYLGDSHDDFDEGNQTTTTELRQIVKQILADKNCKLVYLSEEQYWQ